MTRSVPRSQSMAKRAKVGITDSSVVPAFVCENYIAFLITPVYNYNYY